MKPKKKNSQYENARKAFKHWRMWRRIYLGWVKMSNENARKAYEKMCEAKRNP